MGLETEFLFLVALGIIGFFTTKIWGINIYKIFSDFSAAIFFCAIAFLVLATGSNPSIAPQMVTLFIENLPGIIIGDLAGSFVAEITGQAPND